MRWLQDLLESTLGRTIDPNESETISRGERALEGLAEAEARKATCAALLMVRIAHLDSVISPGERRAMKDALERELKLSGPHAEALLEIAINAAQRGEIDHHLVIRRLNELATKDEKLAVLRVLFHIASDEDITEAESDEIGLVASGLLFARAEFIAVRSEFSEKRRLFK